MSDKPICIDISTSPACTTPIFCYSTEQHLGRCRYRAQCVKETDDKAAERESKDCSWTEDGENGGHLGTKVDDLPRVKEA